VGESGKESDAMGGAVQNGLQISRRKRIKDFSILTLPAWARHRNLR
jgi:hypothetical protein